LHYNQTLPEGKLLKKNYAQMSSIALPLTGIDSHISKLLEVNPTLVDFS
jgi:hypothetical protein